MLTIIKNNLYENAHLFRSGPKLMDIIDHINVLSGATIVYFHDFIIKMNRYLRLNIIYLQCLSINLKNT